MMTTNTKIKNPIVLINLFSKQLDYFNVKTCNIPTTKLTASRNWAPYGVVFVFVVQSEILFLQK